MYAGNSVVVNLAMRWPILIPIAAAIGIIFVIPKQSTQVSVPHEVVKTVEVSKLKVEKRVVIPTPPPKKKG